MGGSQSGGIKGAFLHPHLIFTMPVWEKPHDPARAGACGFIFIQPRSFAERLWPEASLEGVLEYIVYFKPFQPPHRVKRSIEGTFTPLPAP